MAELTLALSPTDLANHLACPHLTTLDLEVAMGSAKRPRAVERHRGLRQRGLEHETAYVEHLRGSGLDVVDLRDQPVTPEGSSRDARAMRTGVAVMVQAPLVDGSWRGRADILRRVERPSRSAPSRTSLSTRSSRPRRKAVRSSSCAPMPRCWSTLQGAAPERFHVVTPGQPFERRPIMLDDYRAYLQTRSAAPGSSTADRRQQ